MMGDSHDCNTRDPLINRGCRVITPGTPYPEGMRRGNVLGVRGITRTPARFQIYITLCDCIYFTLLAKNVRRVILKPQELPSLSFHLRSS